MKQAILVRQDLKLPKGKLASQCAHASVEAVLRSDKDKVSKWRKEGMAKIVLKVKDLKELQYYTGTITALAIGPDEDQK